MRLIASFLKAASERCGRALDWASGRMFGDLSVAYPDFSSLTPDQEREALLLDFCIDWMGQSQVDVLDVYQWLSARQVADSVDWRHGIYDGLSLDEVKARLEMLGVEDLRGLVVSLLIQRRISEKYIPVKSGWIDAATDGFSNAGPEFQRGALWAQAKLKKEFS